MSAEVLASPENWQEITRFTGSGTQAYVTQDFTCNHTEWRIRWSYVPESSHPDYALFMFETYPQGETVTYIDFIAEGGSSNTSGISFIHNNNGTFYGKVNVANTQSFTVVIEQDLDSAPELSNPLVLIVVSAVFLGSIVLMKRKKLTVRPLISEHIS